MWDWEPIDADYLTNAPGPTGGPPIEGGGGGNEAVQHTSGYGGSEVRPNTTMAVGQHGDTTELGMSKMDLVGSSNGFKGSGERPTTAGGNSRGQNTSSSSWGFPVAGQSNPYESNGGYQAQSGVRPSSAVIGGGGGIAGNNEPTNDPSRRPHTAGNRAGGIANANSNQNDKNADAANEVQYLLYIKVYGIYVC